MIGYSACHTGKVLASSSSQLRGARNAEGADQCLRTSVSGHHMDRCRGRAGILVGGTHE
jgi:hypothetical protein